MSFSRMNKKTVVLVVRDGTKWTSEELLTLFEEEGYETRDVDVRLEGWWAALDELKAFGAIVLSQSVDAFILALLEKRERDGVGRNHLQTLIIYDPPENTQHLADSRFLKSSAMNIIVHLPESNASRAINSSDAVRSYVYPEQTSGFCNPTSPSYSKPAAQMAYTRTLKLLRDSFGPNFDPEKIWEEHCDYEFVTRDVKKTMSTMVPQPYVNHIPTITGGIGYSELFNFYENHFINSNPPDIKLTPISRTVGIDRIVDELIVSFTHTTEIDWILPGVEPTGKKVEIPLVAVVCIRGGKLYHEHIYWDQASVLVQIGLLEIGKLPMAGVETAKKVLDEKSVASNHLIKSWKQS